MNNERGEWDEFEPVSEDEIKRLFEQVERDERVRESGVGVEREGVSEVERVRHDMGLPPSPVRRGTKRVVSSMMLSEDAKAGLREVAAAYGYMHGGQGNISALLEAIGQGKLVVRNPLDD